ncbi:polyketide synthase dehydratase domain-containing protein [Micromonospora sp. BRA006-A]|nr:polyketide synthase dehydratase domain-containing protein [Micromonospora sp. BRA006-A]
MSLHSAQDGEPAEGAGERTWTRNASGVLASSPAAPSGPAGWSDLTTWPPPGATEVGTDDLYLNLSAQGYDYGPSFIALRSAWRRGDDLFAELALPEGPAAEAGGYGLHPALLDAALHPRPDHAGRRPSGAGMPRGQPAAVLLERRRPARRRGRGGPRPGLAHRPRQHLAAAHRRHRRARHLRRLPGSAAGLRRPAPHRLRRRPKSLFQVEWAPLALPAGPSTVDWAVIGDAAALTDAVAATGTAVAAYPDLTALATAMDDGTDAPGVLVLPLLDPPASADVPRAVAEATQVLAVLQQFLAEERYAASRLVVLTSGAVATDRDTDLTDLAGAAVIGLLRSAQSENPDRFVLVDVDDVARCAAALVPAVATDEPQVVIRAGVAAGARLTRVPAPAEPPAARSTPTAPS